MTADHLSQRLRSLRMYRCRDQRAPHKPLLLLLAIGRCLGREERLMTFKGVEEKLDVLLRRFGPPRKQLHPQDPFWRLDGDGVWELNGKDEVRLIRDGKRPSVPSMRESGLRGGLPERDYEELQKHPVRAMKIAESLLQAHFPRTWHEDILDATGISSALAGNDAFWSTDRSLQEVTAYSEMEIVERRRRDYAFRSIVLDAYCERCAVCRFGVCLAESTLAIEAAHVKWHCVEGPDEVRNGLALCSLHHSLFDRGAFTVRPDLRVTVAGNLTGPGVEDALGRFDGKKLRAPPRSSDDLPSPEFLNWHARQVFRANLPTQI